MARQLLVVGVAGFMRMSALGRSCDAEPQGAPEELRAWVDTHFPRSATDGSHHKDTKDTKNGKTNE